MSCQRSFEATIERTFRSKRATSRGRRSGAFAWKNPGLIEYEYPACRFVAEAGEYWCQAAGWLAHVL
jgi:hypothetical protein